MCTPSSTPATASIGINVRTSPSQNNSTNASSLLKAYTMAQLGGGSCRPPDLPAYLCGQAANDERNILSTETKAVAEDVCHVHFTSDIGNVVQVAFGVRRFIVDGGWQHATKQAHHASNQFDGARCRDQMPEHALAATNWNFVRVVAENLLDGDGLDPIVDLSAGPVSVDVADVSRIEATVLESLGNAS